jgi:hypothetical protein
MNRVTVVLIALFLLVASTADAQLIRSGSLVAEQGGVPYQSNPVEVRSNVLQNPGFETGSLPPWTSAGWSVINYDFHSGSYSALGISNVWIRQDFSPIDVTTINSITNWEKQPSGIAFAAVDFIYSNDSDFDEFLVAPGAAWTFQDLTSYLRASGFLSAIRFYSYSGPGDQQTFIDDVSIDAEGGTPTRSLTWGQIKAMF